MPSGGRIPMISVLIVVAFGDSGCGAADDAGLRHTSGVATAQESRPITRVIAGRVVTREEWTGAGEPLQEVVDLQIQLNGAHGEAACIAGLELVGSAEDSPWFCRDPGRLEVLREPRFVGSWRVAAFGASSGWLTFAVGASEASSSSMDAEDLADRLGDDDAIVASLSPTPTPTTAPSVVPVNSIRTCGVMVTYSSGLRPHSQPLTRCWRVAEDYFCGAMIEVENSPDDTVIFSDGPAVRP